MENIYKKASKLKLRIQTNVGALSVEQLWDLPLTSLNDAAVQLDEQYNASGKKSFLAEAKEKKDSTIKLAFDIVLDVLETKQKAAETAAKALETKEHNQRILGLIEKKKLGEQEEMSIEELEKLLK